MNKLKIIFFGTPSYVDPIITNLEKNFDLVKTIRSTDEDLEKLKDLNPDLMIVASFGKIISQSVLSIPKYGTINIHPSKLPKYRGPAPIQYQILDGITDSAITFIQMDREMDHGPILSQIPFQILDSDTFESLCEKMFAESAKHITTVIHNLVENKITPQEQNHDEATFTKMVKKETGYFDIENPPDKDTLDKMIRAYYPWPGVWTKWQEKIVKFLPENRIQMEGKKAVTIKEFLNGQLKFPIQILSRDN